MLKFQQKKIFVINFKILKKYNTSKMYSPNTDGR